MHKKSLMYCLSCKIKLVERVLMFLIQERLDPSTDFYKKYTIYWGKRDAEAIVAGMNLVSYT